MTQNWQHLAAVQFGLVVGLPAIMVGYLLFLNFGLKSAIASIVVGSFLLFLIGLISTSLSLAKRLSTIEYAALFLGSKGRAICSMAMGVSLFGWFIINLNFIGIAASQLLSAIQITHSILPIAINLSLGITITLIVVKDIHFIGKFAALNFPLVVGLILYSIYAVPHLNHSDLLSSEKITLSGVPLILASNLCIVVDIPTYYRFANSPKDAFISTFLTFMIIIPAITSIGALLSYFTAGHSVMGIVSSLGFLGILFVLLFLIISHCMINNGNLYSCSVAFRPLTTNFNHKKTLFFIGILGSIFSCFEIMARFTLWLDGITISIGSMGAVMLSNFLYDKFKLKNYSNAMQTKNSISLFLGVLLGILSWNKCFIHLSDFAFLDAAMMASLFTLLFRSVPTHVPFFKKLP